MDTNDFFDRQREDSINKRFLESGALCNDSEVIDYVNDLVTTPYLFFLDHIRETKELPFVLSSDVPQYSSLDAAILRICLRLSPLSPTGYSFEDIGKILQPGRTDNVYANKKYGENHVKTAESLGLTVSNNRRYFLSAIGFIYPSLSKDQQDQLIARLVLRNSLVYNVLYKALNGQSVRIEQEISFLSSSTIKRRKKNSLMLCQLIELNKDVDVHAILERID